MKTITKTITRKHVRVVKVGNGEVWSGWRGVAGVAINNRKQHNKKEIHNEKANGD